MLDRQLWIVGVLFSLVLGASDRAHGHTGRIFEIEFIGGKLVAQGANTGDDDGAPARRPYQNAMHDHWSNEEFGSIKAIARLPAFDILSPPAEILGADLVLSLKAAWKWDNPPLMPNAQTIPELQPLGPDERVYVSGLSGRLDSASPGSITLLDRIPEGGRNDIPLLYQSFTQPTNSIFVLEFELSSSVPGIESSDPIYALLSPAGETPQERLHHASLFLESHLGTAVPEPSCASLCWLGCIALACLPRTRRTQAAKRKSQSALSPA